MTGSKIVKPTFTHNYPDEPWDVHPSFRGRLVLVGEHGIERFGAWALWSCVCPSLAIDVQVSETKSEEERYPIRFEVDMIRCIFCEFCEKVCPEEAIAMSDEHLMAFYHTRDAI